MGKTFLKLTRKILGKRLYGVLRDFLLSLFEGIPVLRRYIKRRLVSKLIDQSQLRFMVKCIWENYDEGQAFLSTLSLRALVTAEEVKTKLEEVQRIRIKSDIVPGRRTIAIYMVGSGYSENLGDIPEKLRGRGYNVPVLAGTTPEEMAKLYKDISKDITIDACICLGVIDDMPVDTKIIYFVHDIHDSAISYVDKVLRIMPTYDCIFLPNHFTLERIKEQLLAGRQKYSGNGNMNKEICLIAGGYPKLDSNLRYFKKHKQHSKTIIYASTVIQDMADIVSLPHGDEIIGAVLNNITDYHLVFRPHPATLGSPEVKHIVGKYRKHPRFIFDDNASFYMDNYSKSTLMITGMSGTAYTYAFTTSRPVIFFSHNESEVLERFGSYRYFIDREKVGCVVQNVGELIDKIKMLLSAQGDYAEKIQEYRDSFICNVGKSEEYFVDNIEDILAGNKHGDWIYV